MRNKFFTIAIGVCAVLMITMTFSADATAKDIYKFGGGPAGGTFQFMAGGISTYPPVKDIKEFRVLAGASGGTVENLRKVDSGAYAFGVVYSGHVYLGRNGLMKNDTNKYENVLACLLSLRRTGPAGGEEGLRHQKRQGPGRQESRCGQCRLRRLCQLRAVLHPHGCLGQDRAQRHGLQRRRRRPSATTSWTPSGCSPAFPSGAVIMAAQTNDIDLVDLDADAEASPASSRSTPTSPS